jgi:hypothetical protein
VNAADDRLKKAEIGWVSDRIRPNRNVIPDKLRSSADPGSIEKLSALRWIPGQARDDVAFPRKISNV